MTRRRNILLLSFSIFAVLTVIWMIQLLSGNIPFIDQMTREFALWLETSLLYRPFQLLTHLGSGFFLYPFVIIVAVLLFIWFRDWVPAVLFGGGVYLTHKVNVGIKEIVMRERPSISVSLNAEGYSFPSGHAMVSMVCYGLLAYLITRKLKSKKAMLTVQVIFSVLIFLIGISRYVINVHYLTDVVAGFFFGFVLLTALIYLYDWIKQKQSPSQG